MAVINTINNRKDYNPADILKASAAKAVKSQTAQATTAQPEAKEIDTTEYLTDAERQRMDDIVSSPIIKIDNDDKVYLEPSRRRASILNTELAKSIDSFFGGMFADYVGCELSIVASNAKQLIQAVLVFTPKQEKLDDSDSRFHNLIEIGNNGKKTKSDFASQIAQVSAHASGRFFKFNNATKRVLEKYVPNSFINSDGKVNWSNHDKGTEKVPLTIERSQQILPGNPDPNNRLVKAVTMEYLVIVDLDKVINDIIVLNGDTTGRKYVLYSSVAGVVPTIQGASGQTFTISIEEIDVQKDREEAALFGIGYVTNNNYFFGSNIR